MEQKCPLQNCLTFISTDEGLCMCCGGWRAPAVAVVKSGLIPSPRVGKANVATEATHTHDTHTTEECMVGTATKCERRNEHEILHRLSLTQPSIAQYGTVRVGILVRARAPLLVLVGLMKSPSMLNERIFMYVKKVITAFESKCKKVISSLLKVSDNKSPLKQTWVAPEQNECHGLAVVPAPERPPTTVLNAVQKQAIA